MKSNHTPKRGFSRNDLNDEAFYFYLEEYGPVLESLGAKWQGFGIKDKEHRVPFAALDSVNVIFVATGNDWKECFEAAVTHFQANPLPNPGHDSVGVNGLSTEAICEITDAIEARLQLPFISQEELQELMTKKRDAAAYDQFVSDTLSGASTETYEGALAHAIEIEAYETAARLYAIIREKSGK